MVSKKTKMSYRLKNGEKHIIKHEFKEESEETKAENEHVYKTLEKLISEETKRRQDKKIISLRIEEVQKYIEEINKRNQEESEETRGEIPTLEEMQKRFFNSLKDDTYRIEDIIEYKFPHLIRDLENVPKEINFKVSLNLFQDEIDCTDVLKRIINRNREEIEK